MIFIKGFYYLKFYQVLLFLQLPCWLNCYKKLYNRSQLLQDDKSLNSKLTTSPHMLTMDSSSAMNHSDFHASEVQDEIFTTKDRKFLSVLENMMDIDDPLHSQNKNINVKVTTEGRISGYSGSDPVFNLSHWVLSETEIKVLEKGLDYAPIQKKINESELRKGFSEFCRRMRNKWYFRNESTPQFGEVPCCKTKSSWRPPNGHPALEIFLSKVGKDLFDSCKKQQTYSNFNSEEWKVMCSLADNRNLVIKKADKRSCVVVWDRNDYLMEAEKQLSDKGVYKKVKFNEKLIRGLTETRNNMFRNLKNGGFISDKEPKYFSFDHKRASNFGKLHLLPKIHKKLFNVPGQPVISSCGTPTEKASGFLYGNLKTIMQESWSYIKDSADFINKIGQIGDIPENAILVTTDVVGLYSSSPHKAGLKALKNTLDKRKQKHILLKN